MSLVSIEAARGIVGMPSEPLMGRMFGDHVEDVSLPHNKIGMAINVVIDHMMDKMAFTGSVVSRVKEGSPFVLSPELKAMRELIGKEMHVQSRHLDYEKVIDEMPQTVKLAYHESAYNLNRMPKMSYFMLKLFLSFGQNIDVHGFHKSGNYEGAHGKLMTLLALANHKLINGKTGVFSELEYYKRFKMFHFEMAGDKTGGFNFMDFDPSFDDKRAGMLSYQAGDQYGRLSFDENGASVEIGEEELHKNMAMIGNPRDLGDWLMHSARAIRTMVMDGGFDLQNVDFESFISKLPVKKNIGFEEVVAIVSNMIVAYKQNPELTKMFMDKMQLNKYFTGQLHKKKHNKLEQRICKHFGIDNEKWDLERFTQHVDQAEYDLFGGTDKYRDRMSQGEFKFQDFYPLIIQFLPVGLDELERMTPDSDDRETIRSVMAGAQATSMTKYNEQALVWDDSLGKIGQWMKKMYIDSAKIFDEMYEIGKVEEWSMEELMLLAEARVYLFENSTFEISEHDIKYAEYLKYSASLRYNHKTEKMEVPIGFRKQKGWNMPIFQEATIQ